MSTNIVIEKGIHIPKPKRGSKYPFAQMEVGDSICGEGKARGRRLLNCAKGWGARHGVKFRQRKQDDGGYRIWRVE